MTPLQKHIAQKLEENDISISGLERRAGLKANAVYNILAGTSKNPKIETLAAIARAFECSVQDLIEENTAIFSKSIKNQKKAVLWESALYLASASALKNCLATREGSLSSEDAHHLVFEIYLYSLSREPVVVDPHFVEWIVDKFFYDPGRGTSRSS